MLYDGNTYQLNWSDTAREVSSFGGQAYEDMHGAIVEELEAQHTRNAQAAAKHGGEIIAR